MRIFVLSSDIPHISHHTNGISAINIQLNEFLKIFLQAGHTVCLQVIFNNYHPNQLTDFEQRRLEELKSEQFHVEPVFFAKDYNQNQNWRRRLAKHIKNIFGVLFKRICLTDFYPSDSLKKEVTSRIQAFQPDALFIFGSPEGVAASDGYHSAPKIAYQGDIDFDPGKARLIDYKLFYGPLGWLMVMTGWRRIRSFEQAHLLLMKDLSKIFTATAAHVAYYKTNGCQNVEELGPTWIDEGMTISNKSKAHKRKIKIIGHIGHLRVTGSTLGMYFLLTQVMPELEKIMKGLDYEVHIIGAGKPYPGLEKVIRHPRVYLRGWVADLDQELRSGDVFLLLNNAGSYLAAYSRTVMAWSMGLCLIVHRNSLRTLSDMKEGLNVLAGDTGEEIARAIYSAVTDGMLNQHIRQNGRQTYEQHHTPRILAERVMDSFRMSISQS